MPGRVGQELELSENTLGFIDDLWYDVCKSRFSRESIISIQGTPSSGGTGLSGAPPLSYSMGIPLKGARNRKEFCLDQAGAALMLRESRRKAGTNEFNTSIPTMLRHWHVFIWLSWLFTGLEACSSFDGIHPRGCLIFVHRQR